MADNENQNVQTKSHVCQAVLSCFRTFIQRLFIRKPMSSLQAEIDTKNELRRCLKSIPLTAIGLGGTIGECD